MGNHSLPSQDGRSLGSSLNSIREASFTVEPILISKKRSSSRQNKKANRPLSSSMFSTTTSETTQVHKRSLGSSLNSIGEEIDQSWRTRLKKTMDSLDNDGRNLRQSRFRAASDVRSDGRGRPRKASFTVKPILILKKRSLLRQNKKAN